MWKEHQWHSRLWPRLPNFCALTYTIGTCLSLNRSTATWKLFVKYSRTVDLVWLKYDAIVLFKLMRYNLQISL